MSFIGTNFTYNGRRSSDYGVYLVHIDTGLLKQNFGLQKTINKEKVRYRDVPVYYNTEKNTYSIPITIAKIEPENTEWTDNDRMNITQWLSPDDQFHDFVSEDHPDLILYLQFTKGEFNNNYINEGYVDLDAETLFPYYMTFYEERVEDLSNNATTTVISINNPSNVNKYYKPTVKIELVGDTTEVRIKNRLNNNEETVLNNLTKGETITIDSENEEIESSTGNSRIDNFNFVFPKMIQSINEFEVTGKCIITFMCQYPMMI